MHISIQSYFDHSQVLAHYHIVCYNSDCMALNAFWS